MSITTFAAIDVGSNELAMKVFEVSKKVGIREIEYIRHTIELGSDTYNYGKISHELVNEMCMVLDDFTKKMKEYQVTDYTAYTTSAIREATNSILILDLIRLRCGLKVKVLSNSEQRFLCYKAIALKENAFHKIIQKPTALVDVGSGSIQFSLFDKEALVSTQNMKLGSLRIRELLANMQNETSSFHNLLSEYMNNDIITYKKLFLKDSKLKNIIAVGDQLGEFMRYFVSDDSLDCISKSDFISKYESLCNKSLEQISKDLNISKEQASLVIPTAMIYHKFFTETKAEMMWLSGITLCDGIVAEYAEKKEKIVPKHDFTADIIFTARNIAQRYQCNIEHSKNVEYIALTIFDSIYKLHALSKRERLLLQIATILHNCGEYININEIAENSYKIVMSTEIIGLSHMERETVATMLRYMTGSFPKFQDLSTTTDVETYIRISKLTAILNIANGLDRSHKQKFSNIKLVIQDNTLIITTYTLKDITLERGLFENKADFFEDVYGIRPILKQKRSVE